MKEFISICILALIVFLIYRIYKQKKVLDNQSLKIKNLQNSNKQAAEIHSIMYKQQKEELEKLKSENDLLNEKLEKARSYYIAQRDEIGSLKNVNSQSTQLNKEY